MHDEPAPVQRDDIRRILWTGALTLAALIILLGCVYLLERRMGRDLMRSRDTARHTRHALVIAMDRQNRVRGFRLTGDSGLVAGDAAARTALDARLDSIHATILGDGEQEHLLSGIRSSLAGWDSAYVQPAIALGMGSADAGFERDATRRFEEIRARFAALSASQGAVFATRMRRAEQYQFLELALFALAAAVMGTVLVVVARRLQRQDADLAAKRERLENQAEALRVQVTEARGLARELALSNAELNMAVHAAEQSREASYESRREKDQALAFLDAALASAPVGFAFYDMNLCFTRINPALAAINGASVEAHIGRSVREMLPKLATFLEPVLHGVIDTGEAVRDLEIEGETPASPGTTRHWLATYYPVKVDGITTGVGVVLIETTGIKQLEAQLRQAQKMEAIGQLAGGIAHDFNNMLAAIKSYSELVLGETAPDDQRYADVLEIRAAADRAASLTRQLLAFSRKQMLRPELVDLNLLVDGVSKLLGRVIGVDVECRMSLSDDLALVRADPGQLEQVLMNLAVNARDAMPQGGKLTIGTETVAALPDTSPGNQIPAPHVHLWVSDTGTGMEPAVRERIFEPFFTTKDPGKGTGLGLATVYGIVQQSGGSLRVDTQPGHGTTFHLYFPADPSTRLNDAPTERPEAHAPGSETLLVIEDDPAVLAVAGRILRGHGYRVLEAATPADAERLAATHAGQIDLILTDLMLPEMNGCELAGRLRATHPHARLLYMSGFPADHAARWGPLEAGVPFLAKPFTMDSMARKVREALSA